MMTRAEIERCARSFLGVPWRRHGRTRTGVDCGGLIYAMGVELGEPFPDLPVAARGWPRGAIMRHIAGCGRRRAELARGCIALFWEAGDARHVGVVAGDPPATLINAHAATGMVVEHPLGMWLPHLVAAFDLKTVT